MNLPKSQALQAGAYKNRIDEPGQMSWSIFHQNNCVNFVNSSLNNFNWDKISESLTE